MKKISKLTTLFCALLFITSVAKAQLSVSISVGVAPPALPVYVQPACPTDGYLWVPGYWAYDNNNGGYYWVPGYWAAPPQPGLLWTPAYWGYAGGSYGFHAGYWGPHVGFYGGINYGFGYGGVGFGGGNWVGNSFRYNTAVVNVNTTVIHNTYVDKTVINNTTVNNNHYSFNGPGGSTSQPNAQERAAMNEHHVQPTSQQMSHQKTAAKDPNQFAKNNGGHPTAAAMNKIGGTPVNEHGQTASNSKLGNQRNARTNQPARAAQPAAQQNHAAKPAAQQNHSAQPAARQSQARPAQPQQQRTQQRTQQRAQPQRQQRTQQPRRAPSQPEHKEK